MSDIDMNRMIADLQRLAVQAQAQAPAAGAKAAGMNSGVEEASFASLFQQAVDSVNGTQQKAGKLKKAFEMGEPGVDLPEVMVAAQKGSIAFSAMVEVRNKLIDAYKEVMSMPV